MLCIGFVLSLVAGRLVQLQAMEGSVYRAEADRFRLATMPVPAVRGSITSADGTTLAMTVQTDLVHADPPMIAQAKRSLGSVASALAGPLGMTPASILALLSHPPSVSPDYVVLKQRVTATTASRISALNLPGIALTPSYTRVYPNGELAANIVGFTNTVSGSLQGEAGVEQSYNSLLAGRAGQQAAQVGTNNQPIPVAGETTRQVVPGDNVRLSIVAGLQWEAEQACAQEVKKTDASNCTVVVMQPSTGKILAMAQSPTFNPAHPSSLADTTDIPVSNVFDPGSTAKVITAAAAMEHGGQTPMSAYTVPESIDMHGFTFHDAEYHPTERWTIAGIIAHSSNVGMVQVDQHVSPQTQYQYFRNFGIGQPSVPGLPAQSNGILYPTSKWWGDERYTLSFGQGVAVTAVQMASVYATIANGGVRVAPSIVDGTTTASGRYVAAPRPAVHRVIQARTAHELMGILQQVPWLDAQVGEPWGEIPGYSVAAKTGTAQIADPKKGGCLCLYGSSFIGVAPAGSPKLVVAVNVQNPRKGGYFGIQVAGPVFYKVMNFALRTMKIPPDHGKRPNVRLTAP
jgi:cell division protein FtsI (penicillin-binding protein 3)